MSRRTSVGAEGGAGAANSNGLQRGCELFQLLLRLRAAAGGGAAASGASPAAADPGALAAVLLLRAELLRDALRSGISHADAEDVVHDTLEQLLRVSLENWRRPGAIVPTIARRRVLDRLRQRQRERARLGCEPDTTRGAQ